MITHYYNGASTARRAKRSAPMIKALRRHGG
jgi:hypothetical protein